jgi:hypothetical protein
MNIQTEWALKISREHHKQMLQDADTYRQIHTACGNWKHQLAQTLQSWARKLEPDLEPQTRHKLA